MDNLDFGLIQLGRSALLQFEVINESHCTVSFHLQQLVKQKKVFMVSLSASSDSACKYKHGIISNNYKSSILQGVSVCAPEQELQLLN